MIRIGYNFTKVMAFPVYQTIFRTRVMYQDKSVQSKKIKGPAILISNHTSVFDYAAIIFIFFGRTLRYQMAEVLFKKKVLGPFLRIMGGIKVERFSHDWSSIDKSEAILNKGGVVGIFPEGRLPGQAEQRPLPFLPGAAYLALKTGVPVIPLYTNGHYFDKQRAVVVIGKPLIAADLAEGTGTQAEAISLVSTRFRDAVCELRQLCESRYPGAADSVPGDAK